MLSPLQIEKNDQGKSIYRLTSHRRTLSETDIVNFVNLIGLHEPPFIDMEYVKNEMPGLHNKRFAPAPLLISLGMGLVATRIMEVVAAMTQAENLGQFHGMVSVEAKVKHPAFAGDTLHVELEAFVDRETSGGQILVDLKHVVKNQHDQIVTVFTEKIIFDPPN